MENQDSSCSTLVEDQSHHSVLSDHQLELDGVTCRELKTLNRVVIQDGPDAGKDEQVLVHTRSIGDKNDEVVEENNLTYAEVWALRQKIFQENVKI